MVGTGMNAFRLFAYLGFCTASVWCVTNTPIGEFVLRQTRFVEVPPATARSPASQSDFWRRVKVAEAQSNAKTRGEVVNLEEHFAQFPKGEEIVLQSVLPQGIDPNSNSQKINQSGMNNV